MTHFFVIYLKCNRFLVFQSQWVQNKSVGEESKVYFSPDRDAVADFNARTQYYFNDGLSSCYDGFVYRVFGNSHFSYLNFINFFWSNSNIMNNEK